MTLCDASPLVAIVDEGQGTSHEKSSAVLRRLAAPLKTTWLCLTEAFYFLGKIGGWPLQKSLWSMLHEGVIEIYDLTPADRERMYVLMEKYRDTPMDAADASLVAAAESLETNRIFTLDSDFHVYRIHGRTPFEVVPE